MTYLQRMCYDKFWRCPGWAGGGFRAARRQRCTGGSLLVPGIRTVADKARERSIGEHMPDDRWWRLRFHRCNAGCGVLALPYVTRWADPTWWAWQVRVVVVALREWWQERRHTS
jgi:hypothetical protein